MKVLHIYRSKPDENIKDLVEVSTNGDRTKVAELYQDDIDWRALVDDIFDHDKIICWW